MICVATTARACAAPMGSGLASVRGNNLNNNASLPQAGD
jgi:hypothetical protein